MSASRRVHALALDGGPHWSAVTCLFCGEAVELVIKWWSTQPVPFTDDYYFRPAQCCERDNIAVPEAIIDSYDRWQEETDIAFARAVVAAADAGEELPDRYEFTIERPT